MQHTYVGHIVGATKVPRASLNQARFQQPSLRLSLQLPGPSPEEPALETDSLSTSNFSF